MLICPSIYLYGHKEGDNIEKATTNAMLSIIDLLTLVVCHSKLHCAVLSPHRLQCTVITLNNHTGLGPPFQSYYQRC